MLWKRWWKTLRSEYVDKECFAAVLRLLMPSNRLALQLSAETGLRIGDVLAIRRADLAQRMRVPEAKTGKVKSVRISKRLLSDLTALPISGDWLFAGRDPAKHRTRQAVWLDLHRAAKACRLPENLTPHSARKLYAADLYDRTGDLAKVQRALNHADPAVTMIYAMSAHLAARKRDRYGGKR